jgi:uridine phosphorylase
MEFHIRCDPKDIARYVFTPGSHSRAKMIAAHFDGARLVSDSRGYLVYTGTVDGIPMTVSSTGMGGPTTAICLEELGHMAVPNFDVTTALVNAAKQLGLKAHVGLGSAGDAFYAPRDPAMRDLMTQSGIVSGEMESDTLFVIAAVRGWRAGALFACDGTASETKPEWCDEAFEQGQINAIRIAIKAMKNIALADGAEAQ